MSPLAAIDSAQERLLGDEQAFMKTMTVNMISEAVVNRCSSFGVVLVFASVASLHWLYIFEA